MRANKNSDHCPSLTNKFAAFIGNSKFTSVTKCINNAIPDTPPHINARHAEFVLINNSYTHSLAYRRVVDGVGFQLK